MDDDSCGKFIGSLTKYLQSLCHSYVDFDNGVELVGHIYLNVDTGKKIDYVLNESVCKNGANVVKFTSNSYHAQPVEKAKKDTPKKAPDPPKVAEKKKNDEDDVIIVGSEGGRRNRQGTSPLRSQHSSPNQAMRQNVAGQNRLAQAQQAQQGNLFRQPRGPNPRVAGPVPRAGGYYYQPRQRLTYPQQPRNFMNMGAGYNPRIRQPHNPQAHGVRGSTPIDTDITFMREEYVAGQPNHRAGAQPGVQQPGYAYQPRGAAPHLPPQQQPQQPGVMAPGQQRYMTPPYTQPHTTTMPGPLTAGPPTSLAAGQQPQPATSLTSAGGPHPPQEAATSNTIFHPSQPVSTSVSGGMPLPNTTHTIFDSGPVMSSDLTAGSQPQSDLTATSAAPMSGTDTLTESSETAPTSNSGSSPSTRGPPGVDAQPGLLIGQVWSESAAAPNPPSSESQPPNSADGSLPYSGVSTTSPSTAGLSSPATTTSATGGSLFDTFNQQPSTSAEPQGMHQSPSHHLHSQPAPFSSPTHSQASVTAPNSGGSSSEGDGFSALVSELQAFNQHPGTHSSANSSQVPGGSVSGGSSSGGSASVDPFNRSTHTSGSSPAYSTSSSAPGTSIPQDSSADSANFQHHLTSSSTAAEVKRDPGGDIGVNIATSVIHEFTEASAPEAPETFLTPYDMGGTGSQGGAGLAQHGGVEAYRKRSGSSSSHSHGSPSPGSSNLVGPESVVIETKPFLHHASSDYDSGCDTASVSTAERLASPQASHSQLRNLSIALVPVDSPTSSSNMNITLKQERPSEDDAESENIKTATTDWKKSSESEWITNMSALNSDDSMESSSDTAQDDDDPNYTPGKRFDSEKGIGKRSRARHVEKGHKGKKRKVDSPDSDGGGGGEDHSLNMDATAEAEDAHQLPYHSPEEQLPDLDQPLESEHQPHEGGSPDTTYKPGTFILVNVAKESERSSRTRPSHTPAEVIATPEGQPEGVWVHTLVPSSNGLWRLPNEDQMVDLHVEPEDIVKTLDHANVRIVGSKVFYKFDDMAKTSVRKISSTPKQNRKK